jgi:DNA replication protein DnaC
LNNASQELQTTPIVACLRGTRLDYLDDKEVVLSARYALHLEKLKGNTEATVKIVNQLLGKQNCDVKLALGNFDKEIAAEKLKEQEKQKEIEKSYKERWDKELQYLTPQTKKKWIESSNIPSLFKEKTFDNYESKLQLKAYNYLSQYKYEDSLSVLLYSPNIYGIGKTHLVCAVINNIINKSDIGYVSNSGIIYYRCPILYVSETQLFARIRATFNQSGENEESVYQQYEKVNLLIIDDIGKVKPKDLSFVQSVYFRIIDSRYTNGLPIIITTNLNLDELEAHIGGACADRLREMCGKDGFIKMGGVSYRKNNNTGFQKKDNKPQIESHNDGW